MIFNKDTRAKQLNYYNGNGSEKHGVTLAQCDNLALCDFKNGVTLARSVT